MNKKRRVGIKTDLENAEIFFEDTRKMITELHKKAGFSRDAFFTPWTEEYEVKPLD